MKTTTNIKLTNRVAVLMPTFNAEKYLRASMDSLISQTYDNMEIIIVDDCSTDNTINIIKEYQDRFAYVHLHCHKQNKGIISTRNELFTLSDAPFMALMDADDICTPKRIEIQVEYLIQNRDIQAVGSWYQFCGSRNSVVKTVLDADEIRAAMFIKNMLCNPSMMVRRCFVMEHNLVCHKEYAGAADYLFWIHASEKGKVTNIPEVLLKYRVHASQESTSNRERQRRVHLRIVNEQFASLGISNLPEACLCAIIWPLENPQANLNEIGLWVKTITEQLKNVDNLLRDKIISFVDIQFRSLCRLQGMQGLKEYLNTLGLRKLMYGRNMGFSFILNCCKSIKG